MKITFVLPGYPWKPIGGFRVIYEYSNQLAARGHEVTVIHPRKLPNWNPSAPPNLYRWLRRKISYFRNLIFRPKIKWQPIDRHVKMLYVPEPIARYIPDADIIFATAWQAAELVVKYPPEKGRKFYLVMDFDSYFGPKTRLERTWRESFKKVCISYWLYYKVLQTGVPKDEVVHIPIGVDLQRFRLLNDIATRPKRIAMMYSPKSYKAPEDGLKALEICKNKHKDLQAIVFGPGPKPKTLPSWIKYMANVSEKRLVQIYSSSSIFLSSSLAEGFAFPPAEAMACGCAVIATDSGGIREYAEHEKTALLSSPGNPEELARNLLRALDDDSLRVRLAKEGYRRIKEFTWRRSTDLLEQLLLDIMDEK